MFGVCLSNSLTDRRNQNNFLPAGQRIEITDSIFQASGDVCKRMNENLSDRMLLLSTISAITRVITIPTVVGKCVLARRLMNSVSMTYILRIVATHMTVLPSPFPRQFNNREISIFLDAVNLFRMKRSACSDVFFNGHTILFTLSSVLWQTYTSSYNLTLPMASISSLACLC